MEFRRVLFRSCTFGAGGSTLDYTPETVERLHATHGLDAAPHVSCVGGSRAELSALLARYQKIGCGRIVALRGDLPSGLGHTGDFRARKRVVKGKSVYVRVDLDGSRIIKK